jgi:hypothetical protein
MASVRELMKRLEAIDVDQLAADSIDDSKNDLIEWQQEQLFAGKNSTGGPIRPAYTKVTKRIKTRKGQPTDRVTLKDTSAFYNAIFVDVRSTTYIIDSTDYKTPLLLNKYGKSIFGLGGVFMVGYRRDVRPIFNDKISDALKLPFG